MKRDLLLEHMIERNEVLRSTYPIDVITAQRHFHGMLREVEATGRSYDFILSGRLVGRLQSASESSIVHV
ncbi:hypothetical protein [Granulicella sp. S156]|uniref:hypothetical protein n=1 Tax=Granulicella sp. S156 TaxID=1747224 RepID=UPI00131BB007|nr:hypothetical protein [Granulicella sp. S156]